MRRDGDFYAYVALYVDDLAIAMKDPKESVDILENVHQLKTKGTGPIRFYLDVEFLRDDNKTISLTSTKCIKNILINYKRMFGELQRLSYTSPL
jgi:hypothetical protein